MEQDHIANADDKQFMLKSLNAEVSSLESQIAEQKSLKSKLDAELESVKQFDPEIKLQVHQIAKVTQQLN